MPPCRRHHSRANPTHGDASALTCVTAERAAQADPAAMSIEEPRSDASAESVAPGEVRESARPTSHVQEDVSSFAMLASHVVGATEVAGATHGAGAAPLVGPSPVQDLAASLGSLSGTWLRLWCCEWLLTWDTPFSSFHGPTLARAEQHLRAYKLLGSHAARVGRAAGLCSLLIARIAAGARTEVFGPALLGIDAFGKVARRRLRLARRFARQLLVGSLLAPVRCGGIVMLAALACTVLVRLARAAARRSTPSSALEGPGGCALFFAVLAVLLFIHRLEQAQRTEQRGVLVANML